ncbi:unnamed protein product, partial [Acanthoscelides obtectus]
AIFLSTLHWSFKFHIIILFIWLATCLRQRQVIDRLSTNLETDKPFTTKASENQEVPLLQGFLKMKTLK